MNMLHRLLFVLLAGLPVALSSLPVHGSDNVMTPPALQEILNQTSAKYAEIQTLETDFVQVRNTRLLKEPAETRGHFLFRKPDGFLWQFTSPYRLRIYYQKEEVIKLDDDRKTYATLNVKKYRDPLMKFLNVSEALDFLEKYFIVKEIDTKLDDIYIIFIPKKRKAKKRVTLVEAWLDPDRLLFKRIKVQEVNDAETTITFTNTRINGDIPMDRFTFSLDGYEKEKWQE